MDRLDRIERAIEALQISQMKTDAQLAKTDAQLAKSMASWQETKSILSNVGINLGHVAEEFFYYSLKEKKEMAGIAFDDIQMNVKSRIKGVEDEFDIVLYNGDSVGLLEIKHKVHPNDIEKLRTSKVKNFRTLFPYYADYKVYLGIGGMSIPSSVEEMAIESGMAVLRQKGEHLIVSKAPLKVY